MALDGVPDSPTGHCQPRGQGLSSPSIVDKPFGSPVPDIAEERARQDAIMGAFLRPMRERYAVEISEKMIGGVMTDVVVPAGGVAPENRNRVLINLHGGGFATGARTASLVESVPLAALMKIKVISIDYRMGPEHQFPAASEDVAKVYRELLESYDPKHMALYGCSAGGLLTAQAIAWFDAQGLPMPGAAGVFCAGLNGYFGGDLDRARRALCSGCCPRSPARLPLPVRRHRGRTISTRLARTIRLAYPIVSPELLAKFPTTLFITGTRSLRILQRAHLA